MPTITSFYARLNDPPSHAITHSWIWICGFRYRTVIRSWQSALGTPMERRFNWSGLALAAFYSAVRRALIVALLLRGLGAIALLGGGAWWVGEWLRGLRSAGTVGMVGHGQVKRG